MDRDADSDMRPVGMCVCVYVCVCAYMCVCEYL